MLNPALQRRFEKEHAELVKLRDQSSCFNFTAEGSPPSIYRVRLTCEGLCLTNSGPAVIREHKFDLLLDPGAFPFVAPKITWYSPILHPNFRPPYICLGDHWYAGWSLAELCVTICEMVQYKRFNIYDPLNRDAAEWLDRLLVEKPDIVPIDPRPVRDFEFKIDATPPLP